MGFWDKLEAWADKVDSSYKKFEKKADAFLDKHFEEEPEVFSKTELLAKVKRNFDSIFTEKMLTKAKSLRPSTTHFWKNLSDNITFSTIEPLEKPLYTNLSETQYKIVIKGLAVGEDDYNSSTGDFKFDVCIIIDQYANYAIDDIKFISRY